MESSAVMLVVLALTVIGFVFAKWNFWITALAAEIVLMVAGILTPAEAFSGFSNRNVVLIFCMMVIGAGMGKTNAIYNIKTFLTKRSGHERSLVFFILLTVVAMAQFLSPVTILSVILPVIMALSTESEGLTASRIVYPIMAVAHAFAAIVPFGMGATTALQDNAMMASMGATAEFKVTDIFFNCILSAAAMFVYFLFAYKLLPAKPRTRAAGELRRTEIQKSQLPAAKEKAAYAIFLSVSIAMIVGSLTGWFSIYLVGPIGAIAMIFSGVLSEKDFFDAIPWPVIFLMALVLPLADAMTATGAGELLGTTIAKLLGNTSNYYIILLVFYFFGSFMTQFMSNTAAWYILVPMGTATALSMGINPLGIVAVVDMAAAASILTPMASPGMAIAFSVGGYSLKDFLKVGLPIWLLSGLIAVTVIYFRFPQ